MSKIILPQHVFDELASFISKKYPNSLPNSILVAQAFILTYQNYGKEYGLTIINNAIEEGIEQGVFAAKTRKILKD